MRNRIFGIISTVVLCACLSAVAEAQNPCGAGGTFNLSGTTATCTYGAGNYQFVVPSGVAQETVHVYGAQGGSAGTQAGGPGAYVAGTTAVTPGYALVIAVGGRGGNGVNPVDLSSDCGHTSLGDLILCGGPGGGGGFNGGAPGGAGAQAMCCPGVGGTHSGIGGGGGGGASTVVFYAGGEGHLYAGGGGGAGGNQGEGCGANLCGPAGGVGGIGGGTGGYSAAYSADTTGGGAEACCDGPGNVNRGNGGGGGGASTITAGAGGGGSCCLASGPGSPGSGGNGSTGGAGGVGGYSLTDIFCLEIGGGGGGGGAGGGYLGGGGGGGGGNNCISNGFLSAQGGGGGGGGGSSFWSGAVSVVAATAGARTGDGQVVVAWSLGTQTITFTSTPPSPGHAPGSYEISASGGGSANPVVFSVDGGSTPGACTLSGSTVSLNGSGTCLIDANQAGDVAYLAASQVQQSITIVKDTTPPVITPTVTGTLGNNGWYTSDVAVSWSVTDPESAISSSSQCGNSTLSTDTTGITLTCTATSAGGSASQSVTIKRDATGPTTTATASRPADHNGWYNHALQVNFSGTDSTSGIASCDSKSYSGPDTQNATVSGVCTDQAGNTGSFTLSFQYDATGPTVTATASRPADHDGWYNHPLTVNFIGTDSTSGIASNDTKSYSGPDTLIATVSGSSTDQAGNTSTAALTFQYDATPPTVSYLGNAGSYTVDKMVSITCTPGDNLSGVASSTCQNITGAAYSFNIGANTFSATATDHAGSTGNGSATFTVQVTTAGICSLIHEFVANQGIANSLCVKLNAAKAGQLGAFRNEVAAQSGKALTPAQAALLIRLSGSL